METRIHKDTHYSERLCARVCTQANAFRSFRAFVTFRPGRETREARAGYVGSVKDDTEKIVGREPLLLGEWAKLHANELLEIAGS